MVQPLHKLGNPFFQLLHLVLKLIGFSQLVCVEPFYGRLHHLLEILHSIPHFKSIILQQVLGRHFLLRFLVLCLIPLCFSHHPPHLFGTQPPMLVTDRDLFFQPRAPILSSDLHNAINIHVKPNIYLWTPPWRWSEPR
ncbi:hypothetical protein V8G54_000171 (mitochondrion) [Vigna mungo]|uniref:Secreted protein n=1 Tax=Vigna mungo TaxID=3915 RepID=A0AAQ3PJJ3_VIGMU